MPPHEFRLSQRAATVLFGEIVDRVGVELDALGARRVLIVTTAGRRGFATEAFEALGERAVAVFDGSRQHVPRDVVDAAMVVAREARIDAVLAVGGGSAIGLAKALALEHHDLLVVAAMPTTYAGSEATTIWGLKDGDHKTTGRDDRVAPQLIAYVPRWTTGIPAGLTAASGLNAMAHSVEALYAPDTNPMTELLAVESIGALARSLRRLVVEATDLEARTDALWGAYLAGTALDRASLGLHHKLCHVLGGVQAAGHRSLTTHLFIAGDPYLASDTVFGVKEALIVEPQRIDDPTARPEFGQKGPFDLLTYDFVLLANRAS